MGERGRLVIHKTCHYPGSVSFPHVRAAPWVIILSLPDPLHHLTHSGLWQLWMGCWEDHFSHSHFCFIYRTYRRSKDLGRFFWRLLAHQNNNFLHDKHLLSPPTCVCVQWTTVTNETFMCVWWFWMPVCVCVCVNLLRQCWRAQVWLRGTDLNFKSFCGFWIKQESQLKY